MNQRDHNYRTLTISFKHRLDEETVHALIKSLLLVDGIDNADINDNKLLITYSFPEVPVESILASIDQAVGRTEQQPLNRLKNSIRVLMENNERTNLNCAGGWHRYIEDIYMHHFDPGMNDKIDIRKQTWRKYE